MSSPSPSPVIQSSSSFPSGGIGGRATGLTGSALSTSPQLAVSPSNAPPSTPYLATFSLNAHFLSLPYPELLPAFPGYQIPVKGQLQLLVCGTLSLLPFSSCINAASSPFPCQISNPSTGTGIKIFLLPYDCSGMPYGSRMVLRQKSYELDSRTSPSPPTSAPSTSPVRRRNSGSNHQQYHQHREVLRSSVTVHICSPPNNRGPGHPQKYYLHGAVKLIFSPLAPSSTLPSKSKSSGSHSSASSSLPRTRSVVDLGGSSSEADGASGADSRFLPYESEPNAEEYEQARKERKRAVFEVMNPGAATSAEDQGMETVRGRVRRSRKSTTVTDSHRRGSGARREGTESTTVADDGAGALTFTKNSMKRAPGGAGSGLAGGAANAGAGGVGGEGSSSSSISELSRRLKAAEPFR